MRWTRARWKIFGWLRVCCIFAIALYGANPVSIGAPAEAEGASNEKADWWSFKPAAKPPLPKLAGDKSSSNPIDQFIRAKLESEKLTPSPEADRRTLIRRLSFDLIGLPPTPEEVARFVTNREPHAYEQLVDRLVASPRYGERWARHWLDTVHYGDTHGYDKDKPRPNAWPYRDYVIRAFNQDKSYSRFVEEQLAGDYLFPDDPDGIAALGFLAAGPWDFVGHVELPIEKTDGLIARYNDRDDMLMTTISTFQSLTAHCARCHNHKFDPISQRDYYGLQAVFAGLDRADRVFDTDSKVHTRRRLLVNKMSPLLERYAAFTNQFARVSTPEVQSLDARMKALKEQVALISLAAEAEKSSGNGYHSAIEKTPDVAKWVQLDLGAELEIDEVRLVPARPIDFPDTPGFGFPVRFRVEISGEPAFESGQTIADYSERDFKNAGDNAVSFSANRKRARFVRVTATRLWERTRDYVFALAELQVLASGTNAALHSTVSALDSIEAGYWSKKHLVDGFDSRRKLRTPGDRTSEKIESELTSLAEQRRCLAEATLDESARGEWSQTTNELKQVRREIAALPPPARVYAAANDFAADNNFHPAKSPRPVHLLARGDVKRPGELMKAAGIAAVPEVHADFELTDASNEASRRAALARWITDPKNLLTRRSIVNRVWHYHFGRGLVETPNDFGHMGALPSHPELLDWLAFWFVENGESLKKLHRLILTSDAWKQSSASRPECVKLDADNRYLWRMNSARLDAETIRDSMLFISGKLDLTMGGPAVRQFYFKDDHSPVYDYTQFDVEDPAACRRSIYRFTVRSVPDPLMDSLDCPDASILTPKRTVTLTALQALAMLNNPFVLKQCEYLAARTKEEGTPGRQIEQIFQLALNRSPTSIELEKMEAFSARHGMAGLCRVIFNMSEFMFTD